VQPVQNSEAEHSIEFRVTNNENTVQTIDITTADFNTLDESGGLVFVGTNPTALQKKYGLANWLRVPSSTVTLQPKQSTTFTANIVNQPDLAPGGHYGALLLNLSSGPNAASSQNKVALHPIASSLLFVSKTGGDTHKLKLMDVYSNHNIFKLPSSVTLRFYNSGNTHLVPRGTVEVTDPSGKVISKGIINENSNIVLPETYRKYTVPLNKTASSFIPGNYKIIVNFRFDGYDQFRGYQESIFIMPLLLVLGVVLAVFLVFLGVYLGAQKQKVRKYFIKVRKRLK
jgi:hypothetical protein